MANQSVSNTLSRWHKVVERIKAAKTQLAAQVEGDISVVCYSNLSVFRSEKAGIHRDTEAALGKVSLLLKLNESLGIIRQSLARANVETGVSALLAAQVCKQNERDIYESLAQAAAGSRLSLESAESVLADASAGTAHYRETHSFARVGEGQVQDWKSRVEELGRELTGLADKLSDANATRWAIELDTEVLAHLGM